MLLGAGCIPPTASLRYCVSSDSRRAGLDAEQRTDGRAAMERSARSADVRTDRLLTPRMAVLRSGVGGRGNG